MKLINEINCLLEGKKDIDFFVNKVVDKGLLNLSDIDLKGFLQVPELSKKEQEKAFNMLKKIQKATKSK